MRDAIDRAIEDGGESNSLVDAANKAAGNDAANAAMFMLAEEDNTYGDVGKPQHEDFFGKRHIQFKGKPVEAFNFLASHKTGDIIGVFHRDVYGDIDAVWGNIGCGLEHISKKHIGENKSFSTLSEAALAIDDTIKYGNILFENGDKAVLKKGNKIVTLRKNVRMNGKKIADKNWVLTAYDELAADGGMSAIAPAIQGQAARTTNQFSDKINHKKTDNQENEANNAESNKRKIPETKPVGENLSYKEKDFGIDEVLLSRYANAMNSGNLKEANLALSGIRRGLLEANPDLSALKFARLMRNVEKRLAEKFGDIEALRQKHITAVMEERNAMEAARKRAEEEERKRKEHQKELSLLSDEDLDRKYFKALENGDEATAREMLDEAARRKGYGDTDSDYQGAGAWSAPSDPGYATDEERRSAVEDDAPDLNVEDMAAGYSNQPMDIFILPQRYSQGLPTSKESAKAIRTAIDAIQHGEKNVSIKVYRAVPTSVKEGKLRNGDWVTPSRAYAEIHGENRLKGQYRIMEDEVPVSELWWDGNDVNEWGYDNGKSYRYRNVENNRKLNDLITRDDNGGVIPLSKRFDYNTESELFLLSGKDYGDTHDDIEQALGAKLPKDATVEDIDAEIKRVKELRTEANKEYLSGQPHSDVAKEDASNLRKRLIELNAEKAKKQEKQRKEDLESKVVSLTTKYLAAKGRGDVAAAKEISAAKRQIESSSMRGKKSELSKKRRLLESTNAQIEDAPNWLEKQRQAEERRKAIEEVKAAAIEDFGEEQFVEDNEMDFAGMSSRDQQKELDNRRKEAEIEKKLSEVRDAIDRAIEDGGEGNSLVEAANKAAGNDAANAAMFMLAEDDASERRTTDNQGNPINEDGSLKVEKVRTVDELTDADFTEPTRNVELPRLPQKVDEAIGANRKPVVVKKNIFEKNKKNHKDLSPKQSREIMTDALYSPNLYGQNQKTTRPHNWILIHNADKHSSVILEVAHNKDNVEIVNWHYLDDTALKQKERQAEKEGGLILTLESAAGDTQDSLSYYRKGTKQAANLQANGGEKDATLFSLSGKDYGDTHDDIEKVLGAQLPKDATVEDIDAEIKRVKELCTEANKEYLSGQPHSDVAVCLMIRA